MSVRLLLNFDLNGTLILKDTSKGADDDYMLISSLAEATLSKWDEQNDAMSFKQYVYNILLPGDKSNAPLKKERQKVIGTFLQWLTEKNHSLKDSVIENYQTIKDKFTGEQSIFPSFYVMLEKLRELNIPFTIILRTFGSDLPEVVKEIEEHPQGVKIAKWAKYENTHLNLGETTITKTADVFDTFLSSHEHFAVQDDWRTWNQDGERGRSGKPFLYDRTGKNISLFFDDNITGEEQDIVHPCEISNNPVPTQSLYGKYLFSVNTLDAMQNDNYYIDRVLQAMNNPETITL